MKKISSLLAALYLLAPASYSQDDYVRPAAIGISFFINDFVTPARIRSSSLSYVLSNKQWAHYKETSHGIGVHYFKGLSNHIDFVGSLGFSDVDYPMANTNFGRKLLIEGNASVNLKMTTEKYWVQPYLSLGVGAHKYGVYYGAFIPLGVGLKVNIADELHFFVMSTYRVPVTTETANYHFQHAFGIAQTIGKKKEPKIITPPPPPPPAPIDTDGDGIFDDKDKCITVPGVAKYEGCPVPDTDKDGLNDDDDKCPTVPGLARYQGCPIPDTDKDGINDEEDKCPQVAGVARYQGCPVPDTDGDGVNDEEDKCPNLAGTKENQGCPEIQGEIKKTVDYAANNIYFVTGSYKLLSKSYKGLNDVITIMKNNPETKLTIDGHTDNVGNDEYNQTLSDNRAAEVKAYFVSKGIDEARLTSAGHGETSPVADNNTAAGRQKNRRVEMKLGYY